MKKITLLLMLLIIAALLFTACKSDTENNGLNQDISSTEKNQIQADRITSFATNNAGTEFTYAEFADSIQSGGPPRDGIPPIDEPYYTDIDEADYFLNDDDYVFVLDYEGEVMAFPQKVLSYHEIVNIELFDKDYSVTYCPLTGSVICYFYKTDNEFLNFGTSGKLLNSNLVMYDRQTESFWPQILGKAVNEPLVGTELNTIPVHWVLWKYFKASYDEAKVMTDETGHIRNYDQDPYGSYKENDTNNYYFNDSVYFHTMNKDDAFSNKKIVIGIKHEGKQYALNPSIIYEKNFFKFELEGDKFFAVYDESTNTSRVYYEKENIEFDGSMLVGDSGKSWSVRSYGLTEDTDNLDSPNYFEVFWFAWAAYYPHTGVIDYE